MRDIYPDDLSDIDERCLLDDLSDIDERCLLDDLSDIDERHDKTLEIRVKGCIYI